jgi:hypothetical protein
MLLRDLKADEFEGLLKGDSRLIQSHLIDYIIHPKSSGISGISINTCINSIKKFYEANDIEVKRKHRKLQGKRLNKKLSPNKKQFDIHDEIQAAHPKV